MFICILLHIVECSYYMKKNVTKQEWSQSMTIGTWPVNPTRYFIFVHMHYLNVYQIGKNAATRFSSDVMCSINGLRDFEYFNASFRKS